MTTAMLRRVLSLGLLVLVAGGLYEAGNLIEHPSLMSAEAWTHAELVTVTITMVRWAALAACLWLGTLTVIDTIALGFGLHPLQRLISRLAPVAWRTLVLRPVAIASLIVPPVVVPVATAVPAMAASAADTDANSSTPVMTIAPLQGETSALTLTMVHLDPSEPILEFEVESPADQADRPVSPAPTSWVVGPGENLWSISATHLSGVLGHRPSADEVNAYWHTVIDTNRHRLPDPSNPDLIYRGIELIMPPVS